MQPRTDRLQRRWHVPTDLVPVANQYVTTGTIALPDSIHLLEYANMLPHTLTAHTDKIVHNPPNETRIGQSNQYVTTHTFIPFLCSRAGTILHYLPTFHVTGEQTGQHFKLDFWSADKGEQQCEDSHILGAWGWGHTSLFAY